ncbi:MAG: tetratricopeptide repeat protein [Candidatus Eisenbacteria bacterium]|nr:tetratricopeptide repeat protein [Candidatus Eisenbacteria bacterium]
MSGTTASPTRVPVPRPRAALALALCSGLALYAPNLRLQLLADDYAFISGAHFTPFLRWLGETGGVSYYRPFARQAYMGLMSALFGTSPLPYHAVSLGLLLVSAWLLARIAARLASPGAGVVAAVVFLAQHGGSVLTGWASCAQDLFALTFVAAAVELHLSGRRAGAVLATALALLSKETAAAGPLVVLLASRSLPGRSWSAAARGALPHLAVLAAWAVAYALWFRHFPGAPPVGVLDVRADGASALSGLALSLLALVNLDAGLAVPATAADLVRGVLGLALGCGAIALAVFPATRGARDGAAAPPSAQAQGGRARKGREPRRAPAARSGARLPALALLGAGWLVLGLLPLLLVGHRWSAYLAVMAGAGLALLAGAFLGNMRWPALAAGGLLLLAGPAADGVRAGAFDSGGDSVWTLARLRRLGGFVDGLQRTLRGRYPTLKPGTQVLLSRVPNMSLVALHGSDALRAWYADSSLAMGVIDERAMTRLDVERVVLDCDPTVEPNRWSFESPGFVDLRVRIQRALNAQDMGAVAPLIERVRREPEWHALSPDWRAGALLTLGQVYQKLGRHGEAEQVFRESVADDSTLGESHFGLGTTLVMRRAFLEAEPHLESAARRMPWAAVVQFSCGAVMVQNGHDPVAAARYLERSIELGIDEPSRTIARSMLARLAARPGGR